MNAAQRRKVILERLTEADAPLSASVLAGELGVSRQIVVGDVALLRASGTQIDATPRGYQLHPAARGYTGILACVHSTSDQMREELYTVVDQGGIVVDVAVENPLYGELRGNLNLASRYDVDHFIQQAADTPECLLSRMTGGVHLHTLSCPTPEAFRRIEAALDAKGLLYKKKNKGPAFIVKIHGVLSIDERRKPLDNQLKHGRGGFCGHPYRPYRPRHRTGFHGTAGEEPSGKIKIKDLCALACINKSTFYAHYEDIYALANALENKLIESILASVPRTNDSVALHQAETLTRELFHAFMQNQRAVNILFRAVGRASSPTASRRGCASALRKLTRPSRLI